MSNLVGQKVAYTNMGWTFYGTVSETYQGRDYVRVEWRGARAINPPELVDRSDLRFLSEMEREATR